MGKKRWKIGKSKIEGKGIIATEDLKPKEVIGVAVYFPKPRKFVITKDLGIWINHRVYPFDNAELRRKGNKYYLITVAPIKKGTEITADYDRLPHFLEGSKPHYK